MDTKLNLLAVPNSMKCEKYADIFVNAISETFNLKEDVKEIFFMELIYFYRKNKAEDPTLQSVTMHDFYTYLEEIFNQNKEKEYKKALFYLSLLVGEEGSEQKVSIGHPQGDGITILGIKNFDDYLNSPKYLDWANDFIRKIQAKLGEVYRK